MRWGTIVPLIGGLVVSGKQVTGVDPEILLSYTPFGANEENVKQNFPHVPHVNLDARPKWYDENKYKNMDFISAVCPCAGLSMLSRGSPEQRATQNRWMIESAEYVTGTLRPKVFWGENAPGLYTKTGDEIREQLQKIGEKNGYSFTVYATNTLFHGVPQDRKRTFYFFWRDAMAPVMHYYKRERKNLLDYLNEIPHGVSGHTSEDKEKARAYLEADHLYQFLVDKFGMEKALVGVRQHLIDKGLNTMTLANYLYDVNLCEEANRFCLGKGFEKTAKEILRVKTKFDAGQGIWDASLSIFSPVRDFLAVIHRKIDSIHPEEDRIITSRECMHLMALPHDFELVTGELNHICQNVPVCTGADMVREVIAYINGERETSNSKMVKQSNFKETIDYTESVSPLLSF
jgi:site-specific DNA-cytosine methylase